MELSDGMMAEYFMNVNFRSILSQVDAEGRHYVFLWENKGHKRDETIVSRKTVGS